MFFKLCTLCKITKYILFCSVIFNHLTHKHIPILGLIWFPSCNKRNTKQVKTMNQRPLISLNLMLIYFLLISNPHTIPVTTLMALWSISLMWHLYRLHVVWADFLIVINTISRLPPTPSSWFYFAEMRCWLRNTISEYLDSNFRIQYYTY